MQHDRKTNLKLALLQIICSRFFFKIMYNISWRKDFEKKRNLNPANIIILILKENLTDMRFQYFWKFPRKLRINMLQILLQILFRLKKIIQRKFRKQTKKRPRNRGLFSWKWLGYLDSNQDTRIQSPSLCRWTISHQLII